MDAFHFRNESQWPAPNNDQRATRQRKTKFGHEYRESQFIAEVHLLMVPLHSVVFSCEGSETIKLKF
eukprot:SAG31_NODE_1365_length_8621_cov_61.731049_6_plen_67_part_00